jgi:hypothetical protein
MRIPKLKRDAVSISLLGACHLAARIAAAVRASREKVGTGFLQKRCDNKQIEQDGASELAHLALAYKKGGPALKCLSRPYVRV